MKGDPELYVHFNWPDTSPKLSDKFFSEFSILLNIRIIDLKILDVDNCGMRF